MEDKNDSPITISDDIKLDTWDLSQENSVKPEHGNDEAVPHVPISKQELRRLAQHHKVPNFPPGLTFSGTPTSIKVGISEQKRWQTTIRMLRRKLGWILVI